MIVVKSWMLDPATQKQISFMEAIKDLLDLEYPANLTKLEKLASAFS